MQPLDDRTQVHSASVACNSVVDGEADPRHAVQLEAAARTLLHDLLHAIAAAVLGKLIRKRRRR